MLFPSHASAQTATLICSSSDWRVDKLNNEVRIFHKVGSHYPQYGVLHVNDSFFRLNYGPGSGWGTSVILMPIFWSEGQRHQYTGPSLNVSCRIVNTLLELTIKGTIRTLTVTEKIRISHPTSTSISAEVTASVRGTVALTPKPGQTFMPVTLSSMHISATQWDTHRACAGTQCFSIPQSQWIIPLTQRIDSTSFRLAGGTSAWKTNAPTIVISNMDIARRVTGWVTDLDDPNEDNVAFWAAAARVLPFWRYTITANRA